MTEPRQIYRAAIDAIGAEAVARALNVSLHHAYKLAADPLTLDAPVRNDIERTINLMEVLAAHPDGKPVNVLLELLWEETAARINRRESVEPLTCDSIVAEAQKAVAEFGEMLRECGPGFMPARVAKEGADVVAVVRRLIACAAAADEGSGERRLPTRMRRMP